MTDEERRTFNALVIEVDVLRRVVLDLCEAVHGTRARQHLTALLAEPLSDRDMFRDPGAVEKSQGFALSAGRLLNDLSDDGNVDKS